MLDTQPKIQAIEIAEPPKPRVRFRDHRCNHCGRLLCRASLDNIAMALPADFAKTHPLAWVALKSIIVEIRCPKCNITNSISPIKEVEKPDIIERTF
jgi:phage FluMu protein Com